MRRPAWAPEGIPLDRPSPARIYDYNLGGYHNFEAERAVAEQLNKDLIDSSRPVGILMWG